MTYQNFFAFSFGGENDFGEITEIGKENVIDFSSKPVGVGFALRNGVDIQLDMPTRIDAIIRDEAQKEQIKGIIKSYVDKTDAVLSQEGQYGHKDYVEPSDWKDRRVNQKSFDYNKWRGINFQ